VDQDTASIMRAEVSTAITCNSVSHSASTWSLDSHHHPHAQSQWYKDHRGKLKSQKRRQEKAGIYTKPTQTVWAKLPVLKRGHMENTRNSCLKKVCNLYLNFKRKHHCFKDKNQKTTEKWTGQLKSKEIDTGPMLHYHQISKYISAENWFPDK
jgi:hypothetical protein